MVCKHTTLQKEMNKLMDRLQKRVPIRHNQKVMVCWDKSSMPYKNYTIHRGRDWTIYLTDEPMCRCHRQHILAGKLDPHLVVDNGTWCTVPTAAKGSILIRM